LLFFGPNLAETIGDFSQICDRNTTKSEIQSLHADVAKNSQIMRKSKSAN